ncbi:MAG: hypothetical protein ACJ761_02095 [Chloroflexota bacterium]
MTESNDPGTDRPSSGAHEGTNGNARSSGTGTNAESLMESVRQALDELAVRAGPTVREISARAAELTAVAADRAAPVVKRAGAAAADVSGSLAVRSRQFAHDIRAGEQAEGEAPAGGWTDQPSDRAAQGSLPTDSSTDAGPTPGTGTDGDPLGFEPPAEGPRSY